MQQPVQQRADATQDRYPTIDDVGRLARLGSPVLSLAAPVTAAIPDAHQNSLRHRHAAQHARERLTTLGVDVAPGLDREIVAFAEENEAPAPWVRTRLLFAADGEAVRVALPWAEEASACAGVVPRLRPVLRAAGLHARFRLLALSVNAVRLYEGDPVGMVERRGCLPASLEEALGEEISKEDLQLHTGPRGATPTWHGRGGASRERGLDRDRFAREVARALEDLTRGDRLPLVVAAERRHRAAFEEALREDVALLPEAIDGNPEDLSAADLHARAWAVVERSMGEALRRNEASLEQARNTGKYVEGWQAVAHATMMSRVQRLFLPALTQRSGRLDPERGDIVPAWGDEELGDALAVAVLRRGGAVQIAQEGGSCPPDDVCAQLR